MSSSIFMESSSMPSVKADISDASNSNLVVVYGKNSISFDDKGLESLIEEKQLSSISVIRLTSPTPSMVEAEDENVKLEEKIRRQYLSDEGSDEENNGTSSSDNDKRHDNSSICDESIAGKEEQVDDKSDKALSDEAVEEVKPREKNVIRSRNIQSNTSLQRKTSRKRKILRPEVVGLRLEEFYPSEEANIIMKEALKMAGLGPGRRSKEEFEFQLLVIRNDHCYTPFTSPTQMKAKLAADKLEIEKKASSRKIIGVLPTSGGVGKQLFVRQNLINKGENIVLKAQTKQPAKEKCCLIPTIKIKKSAKAQYESDIAANDDNVSSSNDEQTATDKNDDSEYGHSEEESDESDNDRDSDLDFDVNNPKGRPRKLKVVKVIKRNSGGSFKINQKCKGLHSQEDAGEMTKKSPSTTQSRQKSLFKSTSDYGGRSAAASDTHAFESFSESQIKVLPQTALSFPSTPKKSSESKCITSSPLLSSATALSFPPTPKKSSESKCITSSPLLSTANETYAKTSQKTMMVKGTAAESAHHQTHREILINNQIMSSPKTKGFTEISTLIEQNTEKEITSQLKCLTSVVTADSDEPIPSQKLLPTQHKGFTPLALETVAKNQLPAQISIQTHQSSSELEAENDKQLDLINSIVQDELKKTNEVITSVSNINENIPKLVKMLESTEKVLEAKKIATKEDGTFRKINDDHECSNSNIFSNQVSQSNNNTITDIDINNVTFLATPDGDDDLPDDLLQLVNIMPYDKTLQEAVKELGAGNLHVVNTKPSTLTPMTQQYSSENHNVLEDIPHSSKSIIEMSISNLPVQPMAPRSPVAFRATPSKTITSARSEPIQIVRGNGRVITLPPIEAPTTRAKRRAQVQPHSIIQNNIDSPVSYAAFPTTMHESLLDSHSNSSVISVSSAGQEKKVLDAGNRRRASKETVTAGGYVGVQRPKGRSTSSKKGKTKLQSEVDATESGNEDDDDPNKLWCICRQPHNNRFMICCDACEDWFHGTCVNITKAMGLEMEQKGIDWTCPKCVKKQGEKKQPKINEIILKPPIENNLQHSTTPVKSSVTAPSTTDASKANIQATSNSNKQPNEMTQTFVNTSKTRIQPGQFINFKDLSSDGKKIIQTDSNSNLGQKKLYVTTQSLKTTSTSLTSPIRTIAVVKHIPRLMNPHQSIKVIRTISPAKFPAQSNIASTSLDCASKLAKTNETATFCIVCKKLARVNSIYCSDDCIRKHAQNALHSIINKSNSDIDTPHISTATDEKAKKKSKGLFEDVLSMADRKPKVERINVYERKSGRILTGTNAPTVSNLKKWLQDNPTFEVVQPGSSQALDLEKKQKIRLQQSSSPTAHPKTTSSPPPLKLLPISSPVQQKAETFRSISPQTTAAVKLLKQTLTPLSKSNQRSIVNFAKSSSPSNTSRPGTPKQLQKYPHNVSIKADKTPKASADVKSTREKSNSTKKQNHSESSSSSRATNNDGEPIRLLVRRTLKEQLLLRTQDTQNFDSGINSTDSVTLPDFVKLTPEAIEEFANATELEMYNYFNRDAGMKYKAKYRSLIFNIKDRKNHTLFAKICQKHIEPKQLVRMTPDEMASQELAQWRKQENKHQLEMIKKSELDLLACAKNYVLKTHKGEEVIESKSAEYENVDLSIPVEDVVAALNKTDFSQTLSTAPRPQSLWSDIDSTSLTFSQASEQTSLSAEDKLKLSKDKEKVHDKEKDRNLERDRNSKDREREKRHKSKDRYRDKSHSRKRSRSHSRSRSRERNEKRHKSTHKDEKRERDKDRIRERLEYITEKKNEKKTGTTSRSREPHSSMKHQHYEPCANSLDTYNLIDQILESTKTVEEAANLVPDKEKDVEFLRKSPGTPLPSQSAPSTPIKDNTANYEVDIHVSSPYADSDQEPTSTVSIPTPPLDPYARFMPNNSPFSDGINSDITTLWTGDINMIDVTSFQLSIQPVLGNCSRLVKLLAKELDIVGRIGPETVWDYILKIKKSPNKEIVIVRLVPASESETSAYKFLFEYLDNRNRLGVVKSISSHVKDFYIFPLGAGRQMPMVLRPSETVEFYNDPYRPDMLIGILIRVVAKRHLQTTDVCSVTSSIAGHFKGCHRANEVDSLQSSPGSPKMKKPRQSIAPKDIDVDAIIKAPIVSKTQKGMNNTISAVQSLNDADEPYSPGGSTDDDELPLLPAKTSVNTSQIQTAEDDLKRKMEEINRQIAAQEMEIAGLLTGETSKFGSNTSKTSKVLANIAIPSNLSQILASIKPNVAPQESHSGLPPPPPLIGALVVTERVSSSYEVKSNTSSRLANLSEAELLSMVPDDITITTKPPPRYEEPPPPGV